jgi:hypothetical protein
MTLKGVGLRTRLASIAHFTPTVPVHRQSPVKEGYFAHTTPGQIYSPRTRPAIASEIPVT